MGNGGWERSGWGGQRPSVPRGTSPAPPAPHPQSPSSPTSHGALPLSSRVFETAHSASLPFSESVFSSSSVKGFLLGNAGRRHHCPLSFLGKCGWWSCPGCSRKPEGERAGLARPFEPHVWSWSGPADFIRPCSQRRMTSSALGVLAGPPTRHSLPPQPWGSSLAPRRGTHSLLRQAEGPRDCHSVAWVPASETA